MNINTTHNSNNHSHQQAIVISCFGAVHENEIYLDFKNFVQKYFPDTTVFIAFTSKMVIKKLQKEKNLHFKNLPQVLADIDMQGYNEIVVLPLYIYPTEEYNRVQRVVSAFQQISAAKITLAQPLLSDYQSVCTFVKILTATLTPAYPHASFLFISHGFTDSPSNEQGKNIYLQLGSLAQSLTNEKSIRYHCCTLEGLYAFKNIEIKESLISQLRVCTNGGETSEICLVPLLLVSGNHYQDIEEIRDILLENLSEKSNQGQGIKIGIAQSQSHKFHLLSLPKIRSMFIDSISAMIKNPASAESCCD
ncbi:MAG: sirohydrochlorin cobaltochelatase [Oligoflexia bacterium]|nr:sirohydrochlorin cobaltochelatase [Oligoflexia bacterium]